MPRKMASVKNANPSSENGIPMIGPANAMKLGQRSPSSKESTVPDTAPTANRIAVPFAHRLASSRYAGSPVRCHRRSATTISAGIPIPMTANTMWNASDIAICERAARRSGMTGRGTRDAGRGTAPGSYISPGPSRIPHPASLPFLISTLDLRRRLLAEAALGALAQPAHGVEAADEEELGAAGVAQDDVAPGRPPRRARRRLVKEEARGQGEAVAGVPYALERVVRLVAEVLGERGLQQPVVRRRCARGREDGELEREVVVDVEVGLGPVALDRGGVERAELLDLRRAGHGTAARCGGEQLI